MFINVFINYFSSSFSVLSFVTFNLVFKIVNHQILKHLSNSKWKKLGTQSLGGDPLDGMAISGRGCWSRHTKSHLMASFWSRAHLCGRPKQRRNEASELSTNENTSWTTKWGFPKIGVPLFYHPFDRFSMK